MVIAELEICHSRPIAPTRRIALGSRNLPVNPAPGAGGILLAGIVAHNAPNVEAELREELAGVVNDLSQGQRVAQPKVRHRLQSDRVGLTVSPQRLVSASGSLHFEFEDTLGRPVQLALGAIYAAASLPEVSRGPVFEAIFSGLVWDRSVDSGFIRAILGGEKADLESLAAWNDPMSWALKVLGLKKDDGVPPSKRVVNRRFRMLLRDAHPDHGGSSDISASRIAELSEARRILLVR